MYYRQIKNKSEMLLLSRNKACCLISIKSIDYFEKMFVLSLWMPYSDNASFKIIIFSFA